MKERSDVFPHGSGVGRLRRLYMSREGTLVLSLGDQTSERAIWTLSLDDGKAWEILQTPAQENHPMFLA